MEAKDENNDYIQVRKGTVDTEVKQENLKDMERGWQSSRDLGHCFEHLFESGLWTDVTFLCKDQESSELTPIKAHKLVLAARSPVFEAMFFGPLGEKQSEVELKDIDVKVFLAFLGYLYTDETDFSDENAAGVLAVAHQYQVDGLVRASAKVLLAAISSENACELLQVALFYENEELKDMVCKYIDDNAYRILESDAFMKCSLECLTFLLAGNTFFAREKKIFEKSMEWGHQKCLESKTEPDCKAIRNALGNAFFYIRIPTMPLKDFIMCTKGKGYFSIEEYETLLEQIAGIVPDSLSCSVLRSPREEQLNFRINTGRRRDDWIAGDFDIKSEKLHVNIDLTSSFDISLIRFVLNGISVGTVVREQMYIPGDSVLSVADMNNSRDLRNKKYYFIHKTECGTDTEQHYNAANGVACVNIDNVFSSLIPSLSGEVVCQGKHVNISFELLNSYSGLIICKLKEPLRIAQKIRNRIQVSISIDRTTELKLTANRVTEMQCVTSYRGTFKANNSTNSPNIVKEIVCTRPSGRHERDFESTETVT